MTKFSFRSFFSRKIVNLQTLETQGSLIKNAKFLSIFLQPISFEFHFTSQYSLLVKQKMFLFVII